MLLLIKNQQDVFYNLVHPSGYKIAFETEEIGVDPETGPIHIEIPYLVPILPDEEPISKKINLDEMYMKIGSLVLSLEQDEKVINKNFDMHPALIGFINTYGLLSACKKIFDEFTHYDLFDSDAEEGDQAFLRYMQNGALRENIVVTKSSIQDAKSNLKESPYIWQSLFEKKYGLANVLFSSHRIRVGEGRIRKAKQINKLLTDIYTKLSEDFKESILVPKTLGAALVLYSLSPEINGIKVCKKCTKQFIDKSRRGNAIYCSSKCRASSFREKRLESFLVALESTHHKKYTYENIKASSIGSPKKYREIKDLKITCKKHGIFKMNADDHLNGLGCPKCQDNKG